MKPARFLRSSSLATAILSLLAAQASQAADIYWDGGGTDANWSTGTNWVGDPSAPGSTDTAIFNAAITNTWGLQGSPIVIGSGQNIKEITFSSSAGDYYIGSTGGNSLLVAAGGKIAITSEIGTTATSTETISAPLILQGSTFALTNSSANDILQFKGAITGSSGTQTLTLSGSNAKSNIIGGAIADGSAPLSVTKTGAGTWYLDGTNTFTGQLTVAEGTLLTTAINDSGENGRLGNSTSSVILGSSGQTGTIENATPSSDATSTKKFTLATNGSGAIKVTNSAAGLTLSGVIDGDGNLIKSGDGTLVLTGTNTYAGTTTLTLGNLTPGVAESYNPFGASEAVGSIVFNGGTLRYSSANTNDYSYRLTASNNANYRIDTNGQPVAFANVLAVQGSSGLDKLGTNTLTLNGASTYTGLTTVAGGMLQIGVNNAIKSGNNVTIKGVTANQTATLDLNGKELTITSLTLGGNAGAENTSSTTAQVIGSDSASKLTLTGTTAALTYDATNNPQGATIAASKLNLNGAVQTFTIGNSSNADYDTTISSAIESISGGITKQGDGRLLLTNTNTYTGATAVSVGVLQITNGAALGATAGSTSVSSGAALELRDSTGAVSVGLEALTLNGSGVSNGGALRSISGNNSYAGNVTLAGAARINSDSGTVTLTGTVKGNYGLTVGGTGNTMIDSVIGSTTSPTSAGTLTKDGSGSLTLTKSNVYKGTTAVNAGILVVNGSLNNSAELTVGNANLTTDTPTLAGTGTISRPALIMGSSWIDDTEPENLLTVSQTGGIHSPGARSSDGTSIIGAQTFSSTLEYEAGSIFEWQLGSNTTGDRGTAFDAVNVTNANVTIADTAIFKIVLGSSVDFNGVDNFWDTNRSWQVFASSAAAIGTGSFLVVDVSWAPNSDQGPAKISYGGGGAGKGLRVK